MALLNPRIQDYSGPSTCQVKMNRQSNPIRIHYYKNIKIAYEGSNRMTYYKEIQGDKACIFTGLIKAFV